MIFWQIEKTFHKVKTTSDDFKVTTPKNSLINNQAVTKISNLTTILAYSKIPTYSWIFASIPYWTWSCSSLLSFDAKISNLWLTLYMDPCMWLTPTTLNDVVGYKVLHFISNEDQEVFDYKTLWRTNAITSHKENKSLGFYICIWQLLK